MAEYAETCIITFNFQFLVIKVNVYKVALETVKSVKVNKLPYWLTH